MLPQIQLAGGRVCLQTCSCVITGPAAERLRCFTLILITPKEVKRGGSTCAHSSVVTGQAVLNVSIRLLLDINQVIPAKHPRAAAGFTTREVIQTIMTPVI